MAQAFAQFKLDWNGDHFMARLRKASDKSAQKAGKFLADAIYTKLTTGSRSGRIYGGHQASAPGEPPAKLHGLLSDNIILENYGNQYVHGARLGFSLERVPYARILELGGTTHDGRYIAPRPYIVATVQENEDKLHEIFQSEFRFAG